MDGPQPPVLQRCLLPPLLYLGGDLCSKHARGDWVQRALRTRSGSKEPRDFGKGDESVIERGKRPYNQEPQNCYKLIPLPVFFCIVLDGGNGALVIGF